MFSRRVAGSWNSKLTVSCKAEKTKCPSIFRKGVIPIFNPFSPIRLCICDWRFSKVLVSVNALIVRRLFFISLIICRSVTSFTFTSIIPSNTNKFNESNCSRSSEIKISLTQLNESDSGISGNAPFALTSTKQASNSNSRNFSGPLSVGL